MCGVETKYGYMNCYCFCALGPEGVQTSQQISHQSNPNSKTHTSEQNADVAEASVIPEISCCLSSLYL